MADDVKVEEGVRPTADDGEMRSRRSERIPGRLAVLTGLSAVVGAIPLPLLPARALLHLRGAVAHEVASRHGLSLSREARDALASPSSNDRMRDMLRKGAEMLARRILRRLGPLGPLSTAARSLELYALGHLFERYIRRVRPRGTLRVQGPEARRVREAIDRAVLRAFYPSTHPERLMLTEGVEDLRDEFTRWIDTVLLGAATLPSYLGRRLDAAFDDVVATTPELRDV